MTERIPSPLVLRGNPATAEKLIDSVPHKWRYTSGVLSWAPEDRPTEEEKQVVMQRFEETYFAGLDSDQYSVLWVEHRHSGHTEIHFLVPRMELASGKSMNIRPPGREAEFDAFRNYFDAKYQWASPDDPKRVRLYRPPKHFIELDAVSLRKVIDSRYDPRKIVHKHLLEMSAEGAVQDRQGVIREVQALGLTITRAGEKYITIMDPESKKRWRMKGALYERDWSLERAIEEAQRAEERGAECASGNRIEKLAQELARIRESRTEYNESRYRRCLRAGQAREWRESYGGQFNPPREGGGLENKDETKVGFWATDGPDTHDLLPVLHSGRNGTLGIPYTVEGKPSGTQAVTARSESQTTGIGEYENLGDCLPSKSIRPVASPSPAHVPEGNRGMEPGQRASAAAGSKVNDDGTGNYTFGVADEAGKRVDGLIGLSKRANRKLAGAIGGVAGDLRRVIQAVGRMVKTMKKNDESAADVSPE